MLRIARVVCLLLAACGAAAGVYLVAGSADSDGPLTPRTLVPACGVGVVSLVMYLVVLRRQGQENGAA